MESVAADGCDAGGDGDGGEELTGFEGVFADMGGAVGDGVGADAPSGACDQRLKSLVEQDAVDTGIVLVRGVDVDACEGWVATEGVFDDAGDAAAEGDGGQ